MTDEHKAIGERIRDLRGRLYTQRQLAERAEVSVDLVRKLEQGTRNSASVASLHRLARALDVPLSDLLGRRSLPEHEPSEGVTALRFAVADVDDLLNEQVGEPLDQGEAERTLTYLWGTYWAGRYDQLTALLPSALDSLRTTYAVADGSQRPRVAELVARGYWVAGCALVHLRQTDAAFMAVKQAVKAADQADDPLLAATLRGSVSWQLLGVRCQCWPIPGRAFLREVEERTPALTPAGCRSLRASRLTACATRTGRSWRSWARRPCWPMNASGTRTRRSSGATHT